MPAPLNLIGRTFNRLTVVALHPERTRSNSRRWVCRCECGTTVIVSSGHKLTSGHSKSCGCLQREKAGLRNKTHGMAETQTWRAWRGMKQRCSNPKTEKFSFYGGRGITFCDRWRTFENFYADMGDCPAGMSLDRIDPNGNYEPGNCRWESSEVQHNNTRRNVYATIGGETKSVVQWCRLLGISQFTVYSRITKGWTAERSLATPIRPLRARSRNKAKHKVATGT